MPDEGKDPKVAPIVRSEVNRIAALLTDDELNALCMAAIFGNNAHNVMGYEKAETLFTEDGKMHPATLTEFMRVRNERLGS